MEIDESNPPVIGPLPRYEQDLQEAKSMVEKMEAAAREANQLVKDALLNGLPHTEQTTLVKNSIEKWNTVLAFRKIQAQIFPLEVCFGVYDSNPVAPTLPSSVHNRYNSKISV
jgi:hypothetical protein